MNWFSRIFRNSNGNQHTDSLPSSGQSGVDTSLSMPSITEDLFVDHQGPATGTDPVNEPAGMILAFLEQDYFGSGYKDGYNYHSMEFMNNRVKSIKATFRFKLDQAIEEKRKDLLQLRTHNIDFEGLSERMTKRIALVEEEKRAMITQLEKEKERSVEEEGWIMKPIHEYRDGFLRGAEAFAEEKLIAGSTGLFATSSLFNH